MALGPAAIIELAMHPKVQDAVSRVFENVYGRIFKKEADPEQLLVSANPKAKPPTDREVLERLLLAQPTNDEMALAFAALQSELRIGQKLIFRSMIGLAALMVISVTAVVLALK